MVPKLRTKSLRNGNPGLRRWSRPPLSPQVGVYRTRPRPIRAARKYGLNGGSTDSTAGWREGLASPAGKPPGEAPIYIASPSVRNLRSTYAAYGLVHAWSPVAHERGLSIRTRIVDISFAIYAPSWFVSVRLGRVYLVYNGLNGGRPPAELWWGVCVGGGVSY